MALAVFKILGLKATEGIKQSIDEINRLHQSDKLIKSEFNENSSNIFSAISKFPNINDSNSKSDDILSFGLFLKELLDSSLTITPSLKSIIEYISDDCLSAVENNKPSAERLNNLLKSVLADKNLSIDSPVEESGKNEGCVPKRNLASRQSMIRDQIISQNVIERSTDDFKAKLIIVIYIT